MTKAEKKKAVEEWMDAIIEAYNALGKEFNPEGKWEYYACPRSISVHISDKAIHIDGVETLAKWGGFSTAAEEHEVEGKLFDEVYIKYKGYRFFEWREKA